jgi:ankyrin repeat protein
VRTLLARNPILTALHPERTVLAYWAEHSSGADPEDAARVVEAGLLLARHAGGVMLNQQDAYGNTALHMLNVTLAEGVHDAAVPMLRLLLDEGADVSLRDASGNTALIDAVAGGIHKEAMRVLINASKEAGALDAQDLQGDTALLLTHDNGNTDVMRMLLAAGADPNVQDNDGKTLLHYMAEEGITEYVRYEDVEALLAAGADPNLIDKKGWTPAHYAGDEGHDKDIFRLLLEHGAEGVSGREFFDDWSESGSEDEFAMLDAWGRRVFEL